MKRFFCLLLALTALLICAPAANAAVRGKLTLTGEVEDLERGDEFTLLLECNRNPGVQEMRLTLSYDKRVLEALEVKDLSLFPNSKVDWGEEDTVLTWQESQKKDFDKTGYVARIRFRVREDAPYGTTQVSLTYNERLLDIHSSSGKSVGFDVQALKLTLVCPHLNVTRTDLTPATLSAPGVAEATCADCGEVWEENSYPQVVSPDGKTLATLTPGAFAEGSDPQVATEYFYGGEDSDLARELFGARLIRAFRIRFTAFGTAAQPKGDVTVRLESEVELPEYFSLYVYDDERMERLEFDQRDNTLTFPYRDALFLLVNTPPDEEPEPGEPEPSAEETVPTSTLTEEEQQRRQDGIILGISAVVLVLCGVGIVLVLRHKRY